MHHAHATIWPPSLLPPCSTTTSSSGGGALALRESRAPVHVSARRSHKKAGGGGSGGALALFRSGRTLRVLTLSALADGLVDRTFTIKAGTAATLHGGQAAGPPVPRTAIIDGAKRARPARTKRDDGAEHA